MKILHIDSATTGANSVTRELTAAATAHFKEKNSDAEVIYRDLGTEPLAHLNPITTGAIRLPEDAQDADMKAAFPSERAVLDEFMSADIVIIGAPMYNFTVPSQLKAWMDRLGVPGVTFSYSEAGPEGLAGGRKVVILSSQGGEYEQGGAAEHQEQLLKVFFGFIGVDDLSIIRANKIGYGPEVRDAAIADAKAEIAKL
ncbi:FMN-dependent NADH-azoreductase [Altericroceibacterium endophyticum]|uniref:FMN dependent NADH:quinone oxidoreductase n=1 Tax=Altericroceibacterium endophyticum TaxID=1808508 RepID=A0A6I4T2Y2_9SPHN|nr:NAD(P)H-dependent oxidoreductase [Altericroceibacterium endophyticum]MXO64350.1 FMN-dependent NADH-azoreductase [Altericroceibacterium endophyticum]